LAIYTFVLSAEGLYDPLRGEDCLGFRLRTFAKKPIRLRPGSQRRAPNHPTLIAAHHSARQGISGALLHFQRMVAGLVENSQQGL
jgi:hypothetical protein